MHLYLQERPQQSSIEAFHKHYELFNLLSRLLNEDLTHPACQTTLAA